MEELKEWRGLPGAIRCDNGPELTSQSFVDWCRDHSIEILYIQPGKPMQNAYIERFNRTFREEVLDAYLFDDLEQAQEMANDWLKSYNEQRPHESLRGLPLSPEKCETILTLSRKLKTVPVFVIPECLYRESIQFPSPY